MQQTAGFRQYNQWNPSERRMARVIFLRLDPRSLTQLGNLLTGDGHEVYSEKESAPIGLIRGASAVFIGGAAEHYLPVVRRLRALDPNLCVVVVARTADTGEWLDAIEAGATDYWAGPLEPNQVRMLVSSTRKTIIADAESISDVRAERKLGGRAEAPPYS
jgi:DNA-binding NtrC family response regulator